MEEIERLRLILSADDLTAELAKINALPVTAPPTQNLA